MTPFPTDAERQAHAARAQKRREKKQRERAKKAAQKEIDAANVVAATAADLANMPILEDPAGAAGAGSAAYGAGMQADMGGDLGVRFDGGRTSSASEEDGGPDEEDDGLDIEAEPTPEFVDGFPDGEDDHEGGFEARVGGLFDQPANDSFEDLLAQMKAEMQ